MHRALRSTYVQRVAIGFAGVVLGVLLQDLINTEFRLLSALVGLMALTIMTTLIVLQDHSVAWQRNQLSHTT